MEIFIILILLVLNGFFSMSEIAIISARKSLLRIEAASSKDNSNAKKALKLAENPDNFLSTVQIGITLIGIFMGMYSGDTLGKTLEEAIKNNIDNETIKAMSATLSKIILVTIITYLSLVIGELVPKRLGLTKPEAIAKVIAMPMGLLQKITYPFIWILSKSSQFILYVLKINPQNENAVTEQEIKAMIKEGAETGIVEEIEGDIVRRAFFLGDVRISSLMTHRSDIIWIDTQLDFDSNIKILKSESHSVYPVCDGDLDNTIGLVRIKDLFLQEIEHFNSDKFKELLENPLIVLEQMDAYQVLETFKTERKHQAIVVDEYGTLIGLITLNDILEALVGDISDTPHEEYQLLEQGENQYLIDGQYSFYDFVTYFNLEDMNFKGSNFMSISGFILYHLKHFPKEGEIFSWEHFTFEIAKLSGNKIQKLLVTLKEKSNEQEEP